MTGYKSKLSELMLKTSKMICQWGNANNVDSNRNKIIFS